MHNGQGLEVIKCLDKPGTFQERPFGDVEFFRPHIRKHRLNVPFIEAAD